MCGAQFGGASPSSHRTSVQEVCRQLMQLPAIHPESNRVCISSIAVMRSVLTRMHTDSNNVPPAFCISIGSFTGGKYATWRSNELVQMNTKGCLTLVPPPPPKLSSTHGLGRNITTHPTAQVDVSRPHMTCEFEGERFAIVYFTRMDAMTMAATEPAAWALRGLGFTLYQTAEVQAQVVSSLGCPPVPIAKLRPNIPNPAEAIEISSNHGTHSR